MTTTTLDPFRLSGGPDAAAAAFLAAYVGAPAVPITYDSPGVYSALHWGKRITMRFVALDPTAPPLVDAAREEGRLHAFALFLPHTSVTVPEVATLHMPSRSWRGWVVDSIDSAVEQHDVVVEWRPHE